MDYLGKTQAELEQAVRLLDAREISQQPAVWTDIERLIGDGESDGEGASALRAYLDPLLRRPDLRIVLTGAGTSAFVGECLAPALTRAGLRAGAVATTDLVGSPYSWLTPADPILLVSFARSGNSPESLAALELAEHAVPECHHLIVTCNRDGALYERGQTLRHAHAVLLPEATNDRGFAMTSSFFRHAARRRAGVRSVAGHEGRGARAVGRGRCCAPRFRWPRPWRARVSSGWSISAAMNARVSHARRR